MAPDARASSTSLSVMAPTPRRTTSTRTSGVLSWARASARASAGPPWSALMMMGRVETAPSFSARLKSSRLVPRWLRRLWASRSSRWRFWAMSRASPASDTERKLSPADGTPSKPRICTGIEGPADLTVLPRSSNIARTLPLYSPQMKLSPVASVPRCTSTVASGPLPGSSVASSTVPCIRASALALRSWSSACSSTFSSSPSIPTPFLALISADSTWPPNSSSTTLCWSRSCLTFGTLAEGRSILLMATTIGTPAFRACEMASTVWGITWSSAATTRTTMSVTWAPRARIAVNAWWPGVSRKVMALPSGSST